MWYGCCKTIGAAVAAVIVVLARMKATPFTYTYMHICIYYIVYKKVNKNVGSFCSPAIQQQPHG